MANFDDYFALYDIGSYREAYDVLLDILESEPKWSEVGDMYVWCADLELLVNDDLYRARQLLDKALALGCRFMANYYRTHGYVLWRAGERDRGIQELEKSIASNSNITNLETLGLVLSSDHDRCAKSVCQRILEQDPKNCSAHIYLGMEAAKAGDQDRALLMVRCAENLDPTVLNFVGIGRLYYELEKYNKALGAYLEADSFGYEPKGPLYDSISICNYSLGDYVKAIEYSSRALDLDFNDDYAKDVLLSATEIEGAGLIIDSIIEKHHDTCLAFILYAQEAFKQKVLSKARRFLSKAKQLEPSPVEMYQIGRLYANLGHFEKALNVYTESEKLGYDRKDLLYASIAGCYSRLEDWGEAIRYACRALDLNFNDDYAKVVLLWSVEKEGTVSILDSLVKKYSDSCLAFILLSEKAVREKNSSKALEMIAKAEQLDPSPFEMHNIGSMYHNLEYYEKALDKYLEVEKLGCDKDKKGWLNAAIADCYITLDDASVAKKYIELAIQCDPNDDYVKEVWHEYQEIFGDENNLKP
jgi:tetratricopeptide (TPR) repeat protein